MNSQRLPDLRDRVARAIVATFPARSHPDNDDFAEALRYADAALSVFYSDGQSAGEVEKLLREYRIEAEQKTGVPSGVHRAAERITGRYAPNNPEKPQ